jgi:hypothetical protein
MDKSKKTQLAVSQRLKKFDSPPKNTRRASKKRHYEEMEYDKD